MKGREARPYPSRGDVKLGRRRASRPAPPMNALRHPVLQRAVACVLLLGGTVACVPAAQAAVVREADLRGALGQSRALDAALDAARDAATPAGAAHAFVQAYLEATGEVVDEVDHLLLDASDKFGAPAAPHATAVWQAASAAPQTPSSTSFALVVRHDELATLGTSTVALATPFASSTPSAVRSGQQTRAP